MPGAGIYKQAIALAVQQLCLVQVFTNKLLHWQFNSYAWYRYLQTSYCLGSLTAMPGAGIYKQAISLAVQQLCLIQVFTNKLLHWQFNSYAWYRYLRTRYCLGSSIPMPGTGIYKHAIALAVQLLCLVRVCTNKLLTC